MLLAFFYPKNTVYIHAKVGKWCFGKIPQNLDHNYYKCLKLVKKSQLETSFRISFRTMSERLPVKSSSNRGLTLRN